MDTEKVKEEIAESKKYQELPCELKDLRDKINKQRKASLCRKVLCWQMLLFSSSCFVRQKNLCSKKS